MKQTLITLFCLSSIYLQSQIPNTLSKTEKMYGLSKFWQEVNYNFIYLNKVDRDAWENNYKALLQQVQETENDYEYYRLLQKFCATLKDGHTNIHFPKAIREIMYSTHFGDYRLFVTNIEGKAIVTRTNWSKRKEIPIGSEIIQVNGMETQTYLESEVIPYISSSTDYVLMDRAISRMFRSPIGTSYEVIFKLPNGTIKELSLTHTETLEKELYPKDVEDSLMEFKWLNKKTAYLALNSFNDPKIDTLFLKKLPELYKAKKLIIDLRKNGGGNSNVGLYILKYLTNDSLIYGAKQQSRLHIPAFKAWGKWRTPKDTIGSSRIAQQYLSHRDEFYYDFPYNAHKNEINAKRLVIPTAILLGHGTASAAEDFLIYADNQKHMTKIGEPSYGSTGQPLMFELPGGGDARVCSKKDTYPDGTEFVGYGVQPHIIVKKTYKDFMEGKDPALERAIEFLKNNN